MSAFKRRGRSVISIMNAAQCDFITVQCGEEEEDVRQNQTILVLRHHHVNIVDSVSQKYHLALEHLVDYGNTHIVFVCK